MPYLLLVSIIWAFSFGIIKSRLAGVDASLVALVRLVLSLAVFAPFARLGGVRWRDRARLAAVGAVQFGAMYVLYLRAYAYLAAYEVALFTILTPLYVVLVDAAKERRLRALHLVAAALSTAGAAVVVWASPRTESPLPGILLVQASNLCFAVGQLAWKWERARLPKELSDLRLFALPCAGGAAVALVAAGFTADWSGLARLAAPQWLALVYLGAVASGAGFFLWNAGARRVDAGTLAVFNDLKIPLGIGCSILFFGERARLPQLAASLALFAAAILLAQRAARRPPAPGLRRALP
jgi:drug/metabolite transporter (DMT)-like permease